ncbi:uncharacterized protein LOC143625625 [Bidens hawaiensis]|uniref:uncharacterized protein LOC143625625 n=1 Tax=Bidens hawaiensis TaxID=980011 RepID=UPI0040494382
MANLSEFHSFDAQYDYVDIYKGVSKDYLDHGLQTYMCETYNALLWKSETSRGKTNNGITSYPLCCSNGDAQLPELKSPPMSYVKMFLGHDSTSKFFMKNIRRYNSMFSFTSLGGKIDNSVNRGNAPYVFRLGGENYHSLGSLLPMPGQKPRDTESNNELLDNQIIHYLKTMLDSHNPLVQSYRMVRDCFQQNPELKTIGTRQKDARTYNLPTTSEVAALIVGDIGDAIDKRDIIVTTQGGSLKCISELHPSYLPLQYHIFFPYGDDGYRVDIPHRQLLGSTKPKRKKCTMREFFAYRFQERSDTYENLRNIHSAGTSDVSAAGQRIFLPSSFTGGARYMMQNYLDAMTICRWLFKMKLDSLIKDLKDKALFGKLQAVTYLIYYYLSYAAVYTIEFQKRGLPDAHICLFLHSDDKIHYPENIDKFISTEIPDKVEDQELCLLTSIDSNGFPIYRRRDSGNVVVKSSVNLDNRNVVPYNKKLLKKYQAHINVEWCNQEGSIKYLFKYINKWPDRATISLVQDNSHNQDEVVDEVKAFYDCRYVSACEAAWRIFSFEVNYRTPSVTRLPFHLPGQQTLVFEDDDDVEDALNKTSVRGPTCFEDIRTVDGEVCATYRDACYKRGLLDDDNEYIDAIEEAVTT